jgi:hypothetical protein
LTHLSRLVDVAVLGLALSYAVAFVRALPWPLALRRRKPLACDVCMVGWATITTAAGSWAWGGGAGDLADGDGWASVSFGPALTLLAGAGLALLLVKRSSAERAERAERADSLEVPKVPFEEGEPVRGPEGAGGRGPV